MPNTTTQAVNIKSPSRYFPDYADGTEDRENESELYNTLHIYLQNEKNAAKTAQVLFIHRSTLFYRLDKIKKLLELNLENSEELLYLRLSFQEVKASKTSADSPSSAVPVLPASGLSPERYIPDSVPGL